MSEWYCHNCRRWNGHACCVGCLKINPADVRWMTEAEIAWERKRAMGGGRHG